MAFSGTSLSSTATGAFPGQFSGVPGRPSGSVISIGPFFVDEGNPNPMPGGGQNRMPPASDSFNKGMSAYAGNTGSMAGGISPNMGNMGNAMGVNVPASA